MMKTIERGRRRGRAELVDVLRTAAILARQSTCWTDSTGRTGRKRKQTRKRRGAATGKDERATSTAQFPLFPLFGKIRERQSRPTGTL